MDEQMRCQFPKIEIERAVDLQRRGYQLLLWLEQAFDKGFISPEAAGRYGSSEGAALGWLEKHYENLPETARPQHGDLKAFSAYFSTYLDNSFDLTSDPGQRLYSPDAHCFCPICSWMVNKPHLTPKKLRTADKKAAHLMKGEWIRALAVQQKLPLSTDDLNTLLEDPAYREAIGLCTYASDLLDRMEGVAVGAASLALWRSFAWTAQGSPKHGFQLSADAILDAREALVRKLLTYGNPSATFG